MERTSLLVPANMQDLQPGLLDPRQRSCRDFQLWEAASPLPGEPVPTEIKRGGRWAEHMMLNCRGDWRLVAGSGRMLPLLSGYLGLMVIFLSPYTLGT